MCTIINWCPVLRASVFLLLGSKLPFLDKIGALTIAILIAILYRHFKGYP
ncbi:hypothetical protein ACQKIL_10890, partial [Staphylococcus aureus]